MTGRNESEYLTIEEAARHYQFSVRTIRRWVDEKRIPCVVTAGEALVARRDLETAFARLAGCDSETTEKDS